MDRDLTETPESDIEELWAEESERRWREIEAGTVETIPWEEVRAKLFRER
jgi:putative addiction module component (TIGR02574 family)